MSNIVAASEKVHRSAAEAWAAYEQLPRAVRDALKEALCNYDNVTWLERLSELRRLNLPFSICVVEIIRKISASDAWEVAAFSKQHRKRYGMPSPHVAAGATIQRYSSASRRPRA